MRHRRLRIDTSAPSWVSGQPTATILIIAVMAGGYVAQLLLEMIETGNGLGRAWLVQWLGVGGDTAAAGHWWQLAAFGCLHAGVLHLLGNLLLLYFAGREVEPVIGARHTAGIVILGQIAGGVAHVFAMPDQSAVGISPGVAALVAAYATTLGGLHIDARLFGIIPVRLRARWIGLSVMLAGAGLWLAGIAASIAPAGIVVGCIMGWTYVRQLGFGQPYWFQRWWYDRQQRAQRIERMSADQFLAEEVDPILDKISRQGLHSLTRTERKILEKGRIKMNEAPGRPVAG
jgi:membrane associated rhomboid family serine protease